MKLTDLVNPSVLTQPVYEPGRPIEDVARELGLDPAGIIKLASNENPLGTSPRALAAMQRALGQSNMYPDGGCIALRERLAQRHKVEAGQIVVGNGSNELIELLGHVFLRPGDEVVMGTPAFIVYKLVTLLFGATPVEVPLTNHVHDLAAMSAAITERTKLVFLPCPNNPTGTNNDGAEVKAWVATMPPHVVVVVDEAYAEYLEESPDWTGEWSAGRKLVILRTFSKIFGMAAQRVGYACAGTELAGLLQRVRQPFNVNAIGQAGALAAVDDEDWVTACQRANRAGFRQVEDGLKRLGVVYVPSVGNFLLANVRDGRAVFDRMQRAGVVVRPVGVYGLPEWVRITIGTAEQNDRMLAALEASLAT
ncbi:histidinol-phosphate transaminase [Synoicihabitans lomoniglobus]|uniref:Histidinol-phosphate aminotransferase n=1 Tax=Synoicihabitans lomoniglobus TaxID=2909285 RepID=A0AAF0CPP3_9BACT|nr:histidinol-phosphate transaminase [Opitutaceae bacterium LMO-M01]WED65767.1 histidinol-phosphate transaminase [Opitutaceae bacterium LMO-M01]